MLTVPLCAADQLDVHKRDLATEQQRSAQEAQALASRVSELEASAAAATKDKKVAYEALAAAKAEASDAAAALAAAKAEAQDAAAALAKSKSDGGSKQTDSVSPA